MIGLVLAGTLPTSLDRWFPVFQPVVPVNPDRPSRVPPPSAKNRTVSVPDMVSALSMNSQIRFNLVLFLSFFRSPLCDLYAVGVFGSLRRLLLHQSRRARTA